MQVPTIWDVPMCDIICCVQIDRVCILLELRPRLMQPVCKRMSSIFDRNACPLTCVLRVMQLQSVPGL